MPGKKKEALTRFNRENIIQSARALFENRGIEKTTVDDIAKEADCSKSTLYVYFKSKEEILQTILLEQMEQLLSLLKENIEKEGKFRDNYHAVCKAMADYEKKYPIYFSCMLEKIELPEGQEKPDVPDVRWQIYETGEALNEEVIVLLKKGEEESVLKKGLDPVLTAMFFWSGISEIIRFSVQKEEYLKRRMNMSRDSYMDYAFSLLLESILA